MIDYQNELNPAQYEAATTLDGPVLVIAGAGSGKTRTIVYRLARLVESGVPASRILLLTFTRKAAQEMLERARRLMHQSSMSDLYEAPGSAAHGANLSAVQGGTFHAYAFSVLRIFQPQGYSGALTVMDSHDILAALQHCREELKAGKGDRSFPKNQTINSLVSKSRNKEMALDEVVRRDASHLLPHVAAIEGMAELYTRYKKEKNLLDYDDLLFALEEVLLTNRDALDYCRRRHTHIMVDEYQDTNPVQARIAALVAGVEPHRLSACFAAAAGAGQGAGVGPDTGAGQGAGVGPDTGAGQGAGVGPGAGPGAGQFETEDAQTPFTGNIMVVGDDAQSVYAFRGADVRNILRFPAMFPGTRLIRLEENYRSVQPVLDLANAVLENAAEGYSKHLFTRIEGSRKPCIVRPLSDRSQASLVAGRIVELLRDYRPGEIAVLFRAGFHSYALEVALGKMGLTFRKFGGIRYSEAAHIKDVMSFARLVLNPLDYTAFTRMAELSKGVGAKTCLKIYRCVADGDKEAVKKAVARFPDLASDLDFIDQQRRMQNPPAKLLSDIVEQYARRLELLYPDDYPKRMQGLEQLVQIASAYKELDMLVADLSLEDPTLAEEEQKEAVVLSTIHSAKGLEWDAVLILDLVEERFPSRHSMTRPDDFEEERRLMYVACTRARQVLELYVPASMYDRSHGGSVPARPSPFVRELPPKLYVEMQEGYAGLVEKKHRESPAGPANRGGMYLDVFARDSGAASPHNPEPHFADEDAPAPCDGDAPGRAGENGLYQGPEKPALAPEKCGFCTHKIFGRGKVVKFLPPDKYQVNFPGVGLKVIMAAYLRMEE